jgi:hypothetical protein
MMKSAKLRVFYRLLHRYRHDPSGLRTTNPPQPKSTLSESLGSRAHANSNLHRRSARMNILPFKKNLTDLVRGLRNNKTNEQAYISQCIQEIKQELRADDKKDKMLAIQKLSYVRFIPSSVPIFFSLVQIRFFVSWSAGSQAHIF